MPKIMTTPVRALKGRSGASGNYGSWQDAPATFPNDARGLSLAHWKDDFQSAAGNEWVAISEKGATWPTVDRWTISSRGGADIIHGRSVGLTTTVDTILSAAQNPNVRPKNSVGIFEPSDAGQSIHVDGSRLRTTSTTASGAKSGPFVLASLGAITEVITEPRRGATPVWLPTWWSIDLSRGQMQGMFQGKYPWEICPAEIMACWNSNYRDGWRRAKLSPYGTANWSLVGIEKPGMTPQPLRVREMMPRLFFESVVAAVTAPPMLPLLGVGA